MKKNFKKTESEIQKDTREVLFLRNLALYSIFRKLIGLAFLSTLLVALCIGGIVYSNVKQINPQYVSINNQNQLLKEDPLSVPSLKDGEILALGVRVIKELNNYSYANYKDSISKAEPYFTTQGWVDYLNSLQASNNLNTVEVLKATVTVEILESMRIKMKREDGGVFRWLAEIPVKVKYLATDQYKNIVQEGIVEIYFARTPLRENPNGVAVFRYRFNPKSKTN